MSYRIGFSRTEDLPHLAPLEARACRLFDQHEVTASLPLVDSDPAEYEHAHAAGLLWVARDRDGTPVGFALCEELGGAIHLEELDVEPECGRRGIGAALMREVCAHAASREMDVTLTTFRRVPWNQPFYERMGFVEITGDEVTPELDRRVREEEEAGLPRAIRVTMRWRRAR